MLSKKIFSQSVKRLQSVVSINDVIHMLHHQLNKVTDEDKKQEMKRNLDTLQFELKDTELLDRRRAENYLSTSLYDKPHSAIFHKFPNDDMHDREFGARAEFYGKYIYRLGYFVAHVPGSYRIQEYAERLTKALRSIRVEDFYIEFESFQTPVDRFGDIAQFNVDMNIVFLDFVIQIKSTYLSNLAAGPRFPMETHDHCFYATTINGLSVLEFYQQLSFSEGQVDSDEAEVSDLQEVFSSIIPYTITTEYQNRPWRLKNRHFPASKLTEHATVFKNDRKSIAEHITKRQLIESVASASSNVYRQRGIYRKLMNMSQRVSFDHDRDLSSLDFIHITIDGFINDIKKGINGIIALTNTVNNDSLIIVCDYNIEQDNSFVFSNLEITFNVTQLCSLSSFREEDVKHNHHAGVIETITYNMPYILACK